MTAGIIAERRFTLEDQRTFAHLSGDANPIHVDPVSARRSLAGAPLVHGAHLLVWALDALVRHLKPATAIESLRVNFEKMVPIDTPVTAVIVDRKIDRIRLEIRLEGRAAAVIVVGFAPSAMRQPAFRHDRAFSPSEPIALSTVELASLYGHVGLRETTAGICTLYPTLAEWIGQKRIAGLAGATYIIGMICPGLHSIFRSLDLTSTEAADVDMDALHFEVSSFDERFRMTRIAVSGAGWSGRLDAHLRPEPVAQPSMREIAARVQPNAYENVKALIVGGSRGIGETLAKVLVAGSAEVAITYRIGKADAERVAEEIRAVGGRCHVLAYDATALNSTPLKVADFAPNQLYYLATPAIRPAGGVFSAARFLEYTAFYVDGFARVVGMLTEGGNPALSIFYPSTVYIDNTPAGFAEYAMAKAAGELLCQEFQRRGIVQHSVAKRLPRLLTDQTRSLANESFPDTFETLVEVIAEMTAATARTI